MIEEFAKLIPQDLRNVSGKAFHSGRRAFSGQRDLYILGFNPGGDPRLNKCDTIERNLEQVLSQWPDNWSAFVDEVFKPGGKPYPPGMAPLQKEMQNLVRNIGLDIREVPMSDVIFRRSAQADHIDGEEKRKLAELCWPFHRAVIDRLGVRVVLCYYGQAAEFVREKTGAHQEIDRVSHQAKVRKYWRRCYASRNGLKVVHITRPTGIPWTEYAALLTKRALAD